MPTQDTTRRLRTVSPQRRDAVLAGAGDTVVFVHYTSSSCGPCARFAPAVRQLADAADGRWEVVSVDCDEHRGAGTTHGVRSVPSIVVVVDGVVRTRLTGERSADELLGTAHEWCAARTAHGGRGGD